MRILNLRYPFEYRLSEDFSICKIGSARSNDVLLCAARSIHERPSAHGGMPGSGNPWKGSPHQNPAFFVSHHVCKAINLIIMVAGATASAINPM